MMIQKLSVRLFAHLAVITAAVSFLPAVASAATGDVIVSAGSQLFQVSAGGTKISLPLPLSFASPSGVTTDANGNVYLADTATNTVLKIAPDGTQTTVATGLNNPQGLAVSPNGDLYIANAGTNSVVKVNTSGTKSTVAVGLNNPSDLVFDRLGNLLVSNTGANAILKIGTDGTMANINATGLNLPKGLAIDALGNLLVANSGANSILKISPTGVTSTVASTGLNLPQDVTLDSLGNIFVPNLGDGTISKITPTGTVTPIASGVTNPQSAAIAPGVHQLLNISTRGFVQPGDHALIGGFIVQAPAGSDIGQTQVLVRAIGPSLSGSGIADPLADPILELHDSSGALIATNDNWKDSQQSDIEATGLAPTNDKESAILATLPDSSYTAIVHGVNSTSGVALVEAYKVQQSQ